MEAYEIEMNAYRIKLDEYNSKNFFSKIFTAKEPTEPIKPTRRE